MKYRREIDGLRAVAVLPVILFHAGFKFFEGGFVGVDVFFVISGYLITTIILSDMNKGTFSIVTFYERRARRILPVLFFVMLCCSLFSWLWLSPTHFKDFCESLAAVSLFSSNILFWRESGYFATAAELKPLLHTWSLAVEEQFYVLFPLFLMFLWKLRKRWIFGSLLLIAVVSLVAAQYGASRYPSFTFFLLPTRVWELAIGALIAFYFLYKKEQVALAGSHKIIGEVLGFLGLGLILYSVFAFDKNTLFPSLFALIPTVGTAFIIIFTTPKTLVGRFLGGKLMVGIGLISYSTYLWHQPLFVFARHRSPIDLSVELLLVLVILSLVLAYLSWRFVENPFRDKKAISRRKIFSFAIVGSLFFFTVGVAGHLKSGFPERFDYPSGLIASFERASLVGECFGKSKLHEVDDWYWPLGKQDTKPSFVVFGDSHVLSLFDAFDTASSNLGMAGVFSGAVGCTPFLGIHALRPDQEDSNCNELNKRVFDFVIDNNIKDIFLVARWTYYTDGGYTGDDFSYIGLNERSSKSKESSRDAFVSGYNRTINEYKKIGVRVHIIQQVPQQTVQPVDAYQSAYMFDEYLRVDCFKDMSVSIIKHKRLNNFVSSVFIENSYAKIVSFDSLFCNSEVCSIGTKEESYYFDDDHLSLVGARRIIPNLERLLSNVSESMEYIDGSGL